MMYSPFILFALCLVVCNVQGKVELKKGQVERVSFYGDELVISVDNSAGSGGKIQICFASSPKETYRTCPSGFTGALVPILGNTKTELILNREGQLKIKDEGNLVIFGSVEFNQDRTLNITATEFPDASSVVILENAELYESEEPEEEKSVKRVSTGAIIGIVFGVIGLVLFMIGIGAIVGIYLYRRNKNKKLIAPPEVIVQAPKVAETPAQSPVINDKKEKPPTPQAAPEPKPQLPKTPETPPPTPKADPVAKPKPATPPPTAKTVPAPEPKPAMSKPAQPPATPPQAAGPQPAPPSIEPVDPQPKKVPKAQTKQKADTPKAAPSVETTEPTKEASVEPPKKQSDHQDLKTAEKSLAERPPSPPTPKFSDHAFPRTVAANSILREKDNLAFEEAAGPLAQKIDYAEIDELTRFELLTESIPCYGMRNGKFSRHDNFVVKERFCTRTHTVHVQEKDILKGAPSDAVDAANVLVERIERELLGFGYRPEYGLTQTSDLWKHLNLEDTEMSKLYWLLLKMKPDLFKVEKQVVKCVEVQIMPIAMLYALILDTRLKRSFREELVTELRTSTLDVIRLAGQDSLRLCAFPLNYLVLMYNKDPKRYVQGRKPRTEGM